MLPTVDYSAEFYRVARLLDGGLLGLVRDCDGEKPHMRYVQLPDGRVFVIKLRSSGKIDPGQEDMLDLLQREEPDIAPLSILNAAVQKLALVYQSMGTTTLDQTGDPPLHDSPIRCVLRVIHRENRILEQYPGECGYPSRLAVYREGLAWTMTRVFRWGNPLVRHHVLSRRTLARVAAHLLPFAPTIQVVDKNIIGKHLVVAEGGRLYPVDWTPVPRPRDYPFGRYLAWAWLKTPRANLGDYAEVAARYGILPLFAFSVIGIGWDIVQANETTDDGRRKLAQIGEFLRTWKLS